MKDFTLTALERLYNAYLRAGFKSVTFEDYLIHHPQSNTVILRHDVDLKPGNSLRVAQLQHRLGMLGTFYFRIVPESFDVDVLKEIASLGHEIGYHYEDMTICKGDTDKAFEHFKKTLELLRRYYPVKTICMHGSPLSRWDARDLWKKYDYKSLGITGEPYFDLDLSNGIYITDTGRTWDGDAYSIRDRVTSGHALRFKTTFDIINALDAGKMPSIIMQTFHPQRWTDNNGEWLKELVVQRIKNIAKAALRKVRG
jgi:hypothetical protein